MKTPMLTEWSLDAIFWRARGFAGEARERIASRLDDARERIAKRLYPWTAEELEAYKATEEARAGRLSKAAAERREAQRERDEARAIVAQQKIDLKGRQTALAKAQTRIAELQLKLSDEQCKSELKSGLAGDRIAKLNAAEAELAAHRGSAEAWAERVVTCSPGSRGNGFNVPGFVAVNVAGALDGWVLADNGNTVVVKLRAALIASLPPCRPLTKEDIEAAAKAQVNAQGLGDKWTAMSDHDRQYWTHITRAALAATGCVLPKEQRRIESDWSP